MWSKTSACRISFEVNHSLIYLLTFHVNAVAIFKPRSHIIAVLLNHQTLPKAKVDHESQRHARVSIVGGGACAHGGGGRSSSSFSLGCISKIRCPDASNILSATAVESQLQSATDHDGSAGEPLRGSFLSIHRPTMATTTVVADASSRRFRWILPGWLLRCLSLNIPK